MISDEQLAALLAPPHQPYTGKVTNPDPISRELALTGQLNPVYAKEQAMVDGRFLSGLGTTELTNSDEVMEDHADVKMMEEQDDVLGSGIFDFFRRPATANPDLGVFEAHYSIPGPHAREVPFTVNREITDITSGADVVGIPSGGLNYVEHGGALPYLEPTDLYQPYAQPGVGGKGWDPDSTLAPAEAYFGFIPPGRKDNQGGQAIPNVSDPKIAARRAKQGFHVPGQPARDPFYSIHGVPGVPSSRVAPMSPTERSVAYMPEVFPVIHQIPATMSEGDKSESAVSLNGLGQDDSNKGPGVGTWLALLGAGVAAGVALRVFTSKKGK